MDLQIALGYPIGAMPEREFKRWQQYANQKALPSRRIEFYLANIALLIERTMGGAQNVTLKDYLFDPPEDQQNIVATIDNEEEAWDFFGLTDEERERVKNG